MINATTTVTGVTEQALESLSRLMNHTLFHKPWVKSNKFDFHIAVRQNKSVNLKDEHFNRLSATCVVSRPIMWMIWHFACRSTRMSRTS